MLPLLFAAAAPLAQLAGEEIAKLIGGDDPATAGKGSAVAQALVSAAGAVAGVPITTAQQAGEVARVFADDPAKLAEFHRAVNDQVLSLLTLDNQDRGSARQQTVELARVGSGIAWGAPVVSLVVLVTFGTVLALVLTKSIPPGQDTTVSLMLGALTTMATAVVSYWVGSSAGSAAKDRLLRGRG